jgi:hypothetical protein
MSNTNMSRRLKRLESELAPPSKKPVLVLIVTSPGKPAEIRELSFEPGRKRTWLANGGR